MSVLYERIENGKIRVYPENMPVNEDVRKMFFPKSVFVEKDGFWECVECEAIEWAVFLNGMRNIGEAGGDMDTAIYFLAALNLFVDWYRGVEVKTGEMQA